jgi:hypothetical protein
MITLPIFVGFHQDLVSFSYLKSPRTNTTPVLRMDSRSHSPQSPTIDSKENEPDLEPYIYSALTDSDKIRILRLHSNNDRVECSLEEISHTDGGYHALSYAWGEDMQFSRAIVRGKDGPLGYISLTKNVAHALCDLHDCDETTDKAFWIDQICINQSDDEEKGKQVGIMGTIFKNAEIVITYLGPTENEDIERKGMNLMQRLYYHFEPIFAEIFAQKSPFDGWQNRSTYKVQTLPNDLENGIKSLKEQSGWKGFEDWHFLIAMAMGDWTERLW